MCPCTQSHSACTHLSLPVHSHDSPVGLVRCCHKDGVFHYSVHEDARASLQIKNMDVPQLGDEVDDIKLARDLQYRHPNNVTHMLACTYVHIYILHMYVCMNACIYYQRMYVCMYVLCMYMYSPTHYFSNDRAAGYRYIVYVRRMHGVHIGGPLHTDLHCYREFLRLWPQSDVQSPLEGLLALWRIQFCNVQLKHREEESC